MMQETRQQILEVLRGSQALSVDEIVDALRERRGDNITPVTVRHHLGILQADGFIAASELRHRITPGRPSYLYTLTEKGLSQFPTNYHQLTEGLLRQLSKYVQPETVNVILEGVADDMTRDIVVYGTMVERLNKASEYLCGLGYDVHWEEDNGHQSDGAKDYKLIMKNCPYHHLSHRQDTLCHLDMRMLTKILGVVPRVLSTMANDDKECHYLIRDKQDIKN